MVSLTHFSLIKWQYYTSTDENETGEIGNDVDVDNLVFEAEQMSDTQDGEQQG